MTDAINSYVNEIDMMQTIQTCLTGTEAVPSDIPNSRPAKPGKGGSIPQEGLNKLKVLLLLPTGSFL